MQEQANSYSTIHYQNYLGLNQILNAQQLQSELVGGDPAHEEMLFIIVHQVYELWFKQIIHELTSVLELFQQKRVDERNIGISISRLNRVIEIQKLLIEQIGIMETMTPLDFLDFRKHLFPASGFQSFQFRMIENLLGLPEGHRITYNGHSYDSVFDEAKKSQLESVLEQGSLFDAMENWLARTPFLQVGDFQFFEAYRDAVQRMLERERHAINNSPFLGGKEKEMRLKMLGNTDTYFKSVLNKEMHLQMQAEGKVRMSYESTIAALFINLYRDAPLLHLPFRLLTCFVEMDDALTTWRYRHAQMVMRMLGNKIGTGGSSGHQYLNETARKHHIFKDLHSISTLLIPRSELPALPAEVEKQLGFYYTSTN